MDRTCPSVAQVLDRVDGGLIRIRRPGGRIDAAGLDAVAYSAHRWGSGVVEITNRANLQLRGIRAGTAHSAASELESAGLSGGAGPDRRRNILVNPLGDMDPAAVDFGPAIGPLLAALDEDPRLDELDDKFGFALDGGGSWSIAGRRAAVVVSPGRAPGTACLVCSWATPEVVDMTYLPEALAGAAAASLGRPRCSSTVPGDVRPLSGPLGSGNGWVGAMPVLGRTDASTVAALAALARRYSAGVVRLTPWRGVVYPGVEAGDDHDRLLAELSELGLVVDSADPAAGVVACAGSSGCTSALTDAMGDARRVIAARRSSGAPTVDIHVSGCARQCAQPFATSVALIAPSAGRYDLYRDGKLCSPGLPDPEAVTLVSMP